MQQIKFDQLQETLYYERMDNGLEVYILPKHGFHKTFATFTTKYGSIDNHFIPPGKEEVSVPDGIAHFLEHKMFEEEEGDIFHDFSKQGAQANAFTSFDRTAYLFSSTDHVQKNLETLLNFVQSPYFTEENVEKEKGIIEQEIRMYQDNPDWRAFFGLIQAMYQRFPVRIDIAGTVESIYKITKEMLYECYETFYHPSNMLLFVVGQVKPDEVLSLVKENQAQKPFKDKSEIARLFDKEPSAVHQTRLEIDLSVETPKCMLGYKETYLGLQGKEMLKQEVTTDLLMDMLFGQSSSFYQEHLESGLIDDSFGSDYTLEQHYGFSMLGGNTNNPDELIAKVQEYVKDILSNGMDQLAFERSRKKKIGSFLKQLNSPEFIANQFTRFQFNDMNLFDVIPVLEEITFEDILNRTKEHFRPEQFAVCIVK
ncbi:EF-P 5-aminopentanol modification-associated protein YfmH [Bacillus horti]|uniref:Zn-dependent peptidase n=1 Tax=Caldalkalibacillus horti TaxID=77523 RepID=A0ABT9VUX4_9BACI|nr:pitrilysin family protein [Bacillus horti]MDQ0164788.1 putative Zn-dependent peptidase [Bacillus horti]